MKETELRHLLQSLTVPEKIGQLIQLSGEFFQSKELSIGPQQKLGIDNQTIDLVGSVLNVTGIKATKQIQEAYLKKSRHKIPLLFMADIIYGYKTIFPIPLGLGATWNPKMIQEAYQVIAKEAASAGAHVTYAPMVDLVRDARWGRCLESTGEDVVLNSDFAKAMVEGFQGKLKPEESIASCVKHFAAYGAPEGGREYNTVELSKRTLFENYLPAYKAAVDARCMLVMTSFNTIDGIPATANQEVMKELLREQWGFQGVIISDYAAIQELVAHGIAEDNRTATRLALEETVDIDMKTSCYAKEIQPLLQNGEISENLLDEACWRVLKLKNDLGLFEDPYRGATEEKEKNMLGKIQHRMLARKVASEAMVLLQNKQGVLPIKQNQTKVALIGPYTDTKDLIGLWAVHGNREAVVTLREAFQEELTDTNFTCAKGCNLLEDYSSLSGFGVSKEKSQSMNGTKQEKEILLKEAILAATSSDVIVLALGEHTLQSGEAGSRVDIRLPKHQRELLAQMHKLGKPIILLVFSGRPLDLSEEISKAEAIIEAWFPGTEGAHALTDIIFGKENPSGRLSMSFPRSVGQVPIHYDEYATGRPKGKSEHTGRFVSKYLDCENTPLFSFGYGLSYHDTKYSNLQLSTHEITKDDRLHLSVDIENKTSISGIETVQFYIQDVVGSVVRPIKELKAYKKVKLSPYDKQTVCFDLDVNQLKFYRKDYTFGFEKGKFKVYIGKNSQDVLTDTFTLK